MAPLNLYDVIIACCSGALFATAINGIIIKLVGDFEKKNRMRYFVFFLECFKDGEGRNIMHTYYYAELKDNEFIAGERLQKVFPGYVVTIKSMFQFRDKGDFDTFRKTDTLAQSETK